MTPDERMERLILSLNTQSLRILCAALWRALQARFCTNDAPDEWVSWFERNIGGAK